MKNSVQGLHSQPLIFEKSSLQISSAIALAMGKSSVSGDCQCLRGRHSRLECVVRVPARLLLTIWPYSWSRSRTRFSGASSFRAFCGRGLPLCLSTKLRNHSLSARACAATPSNSPGTAISRIEANTSGCTIFAIRSQSTRSPPEVIHSTGVSTGLAIELRKSKAGEPPTKKGAGRGSVISLVKMTIIAHVTNPVDNLSLAVFYMRLVNIGKSGRVCHGPRVSRV